MGTPGLNAPAPNTVIAGKYKVGAVIAAGGMGVVVEGEHSALGQRVAIKFLLPEAAAQADMIERFLREARAAARLQSDHVVRVFDIGTDEEGRPYMVMERLMGSDLDAEMEARGALPVGEAVGYVVEALDAIVEAHAAGIVHRDLKPSNLFLVKKPDGSRRVKVLDFGISKFAEAGAPDRALTSTQSMLGSPGYMSPEQVRSTRNVDVRTDVWALGVILYEMLSGTSAFPGESLGDIFAKIREDDLPDIRVHRPEVPEGLALVLGRAVARDRNSRVADAEALRTGLLPYAGQGIESAVSRRDPLSSGTTLAQRPTEAMTGGTLSAWTDRTGTHHRSRLVWLGGGVAALAVAIGIWSVERSSAVTAEPRATASGMAPPSPSATQEVSSAAPLIAPAVTAIVSAPSVAPVPTASVAPAPTAAVTRAPTAPSAPPRLTPNAPTTTSRRAAMPPALPRPTKTQPGPTQPAPRKDTLGL